MIAGVLAVLVIVALIIQVMYYKNKAEEFESLFELSKGYETSLGDGVHDDVAIKVASVAGMTKGMAVTILDKKGIHKQGIVVATPKLTKDGSIAKKRGRKPKNEPRD